MKTSVKIQLESTEIRRFEIEENMYEDYVSKLEKICKIPQGRKIEYLDCDGDWIALSTEEEFNEALKYKKDKNVLFIRECNGKEKRVKKERKGKCIIYSSCPFKRRRGRRGMRRFEKFGMKDFPRRVHKRCNMNERIPKRNCRRDHLSPFEKRERRMRRFEKCGKKEFFKNQCPFEEKYFIMKRDRIYERRKRKIMRIKEKMEMIKNSRIPEEVKDKLMFEMKEKIHNLKDKHKFREERKFKGRKCMMKNFMKRREFMGRRFKNEMY